MAIQIKNWTGPQPNGGRLYVHCTRVKCDGYTMELPLDGYLSVMLSLAPAVASDRTYQFDGRSVSLRVPSASGWIWIAKGAFQHFVGQESVVEVVARTEPALGGSDLIIEKVRFGRDDYEINP